MTHTEFVPADLRVLAEMIYQYEKGVRKLSLYTFPECYASVAENRLRRDGIDYVVQPVGNSNVNVFFGRPECIAVIREMVNRPLNELSPEEDFILGTLLGYDVCSQCERYCKRKNSVKTQTATA